MPDQLDHRQDRNKPVFQHERNLERATTCIRRGASAAFHQIVERSWRRTEATSPSSLYSLARSVPYYLQYSYDNHNVASFLELLQLWLFLAWC